MPPVRRGTRHHTADHAAGDDPTDALAALRARYLGEHAPPGSVTLGIDLALQRAAAVSLGERTGAVLALGTAMRHNGWPVDVAAAVILAVLLLVRRSWRAGVRVCIALLIGAVGGLAIAETTLAALRHAANYELPELSDVLAECKGSVKFDIELKESGYEEQVMDAIREHLADTIKMASKHSRPRCHQLNY